MKYKRRWKCFSLVELIVVLTIMAIVAAMCAPGIAAYVRTAKVQNYQTALNNLVDEVQTQLPQSRYWNWEEVQENAEAILRSDAGRGVSDVSTPSDIAANKRIYQVTNASTDANIVYYLTLAYTPVTSGTKQNIQITASCDGYTSVTADQSCEVLLKSNYTDAENYPMQLTTVTTEENAGWRALDDRVKTGAEWNTLFADDATWGKYNWNKFYSILDEVSDSVYRINTTDYPLNSVKFVQFGMKAYAETGLASTPKSRQLSMVTAQFQRGTTSVDANGHPVFGSGVQDDIEKDSIYVFIGNDMNKDDFEFVSTEIELDKIKTEMEAHNWLKYTTIFNADDGGGYNVKVKDTPEGDAYLSKYGIPEIFKTQNAYNLDGTEPDENYNPVIYYRIVLKQGDADSSAGAILINGTNNMNPEKDSIQIYVDTTQKNEPEVYHQQVSAPTGTYFNTSGLTAVDGQTNTYIQDETGYKVVRKEWNNEVTVFVPLPPQSESGYYGYGYQITSDENGTYMPYFGNDNSLLKKVYFSDLKISDGYDGSWLENGELTIFYRNERGTSPYHIQMHKQDVFIDLVNTGYQVGDNLQITITGANASYIQKNLKDSSKFMIVETTQRVYAGSGSPIPSLDDVTIDVISSDVAVINIPWTWRSYPYIRLSFDGALSNVGASVDLKWDRKTSSHTKEVSTSLPMLTINGNDDYANVTLDWSKCDSSIIKTYANELHVKFPATLQYTLYDKEYNVISYTPTSDFRLGSIYTYAGYDALINGGRIHFYCDGVSANTIQVDIEMSQRLKDALNAITITTTPASTTTVPVVTTAAATVTTTVTTTTITTVTTSATNAAATSTTANSAEASTTETTAATTTVTSAYDIVLAPEMEDRCELVAVNGPLDEQMRFMIEIRPKDGWQFADPVQLYVNGQTASSTGKSTRWIIWYNEAYAPYVITVDGIVPVQTTETTDVTTVTTTVTTTAATTTTTTTTELTTTDTTTTTIVTTTTTTTLLEEEKMVKIHVLAGDTDVCKVVQIQNNTSNEWYSTSSTDNKDFTVVLKSGEYFHIWTKSDWNGTNIDTGYHPKADNLCDWCSPGSHITYDSLTVDELWIYNGKVYEEDPVTILPESLQRTENIASLIAAFRKPTANPVTTTSTTATAATTAVTITTTTTTTAVTSAGIAAHEDGMAVGLDAESAKVCNITFEKSLFNESGMCYFTITPKDGYVLPDNYTVKVGTVTLTSQNYKATTNQWYFWKSSGMNEYTIHVEGVIAE